MNEDRKVEEFFAGIETKARPGAKERILSAAEGELARSVRRRRLYGWPRLLIRRTIMRNRWTKLTTMAAAALMMVVIANLWQGPAGRAYALEETLDALREVKSFHMQSLAVRAVDIESVADADWELHYELWAECDEKGRAEKIRVEKRVEGRRLVYLWEKGVKTTYYPGSNQAEIKIDPHFAQNWAWKSSHPRWAVHELYRKNREGSYDIEVREPKRKGEPIVILSTTLEKHRRDDRAFEGYYTIDPQTKLLLESGGRTWCDEWGDESVFSKAVYLDYDKDIPDDAFKLPRGRRVIISDQITGIGMEQGDMTDEEAVREVTKRVLDALVARDYSKAAHLMGYADRTDKMREYYEDDKFGGPVDRVEWIGEGEIRRPELSPRQYSIKVTFVRKTSDGKETVEGPPEDPNAKEGRTGHKTAAVAGIERDGKVYWIANP